MKPDANISVVIVGGGFCGVMTLVNLINRSSDKINITLINKHYPLARGIAYKTYSDQHILNVEARKMSAFPDKPDHFVEWCHHQKDIERFKVDLPHAYLPRNIYGRYLEDILNDAIRNLPHHINVDIFEDEVTDIEKQNEGFVVRTSSDKKISAHKIVLATGNSNPAPPKFSDPCHLKSKNFHSNPWKENAVLGLNGEDTVLIIGTGLTMVDVVIGLQEKNFNGKIISLSPHGFNILSHRRSNPQRSILDELSPPYDLESLFRLFYKYIRQARKHGEPGETVVDAIRAKTQEIWQNLSLADKKKFMTHLRHLWGVARHRLPAKVFLQVHRMIKLRKLEVIAGRIKNINENNNKFEVEILKRKDQVIQKIFAARIINCTGPQTDIQKQNSLLFDNLLKKGIIRSDEMNLGIDATAEGRVIDSEKNISEDLFAIGSLLKGKLWESTAVPELRIQAFRVAEIISNN